SARAFSIAARCASASSAAEKRLLFSPSRAAAIVSDVSSLTAAARPLPRSRPALSAQAPRRQSGPPPRAEFLAFFRRQRLEHVEKCHFAGDAHQQIPRRPLAVTLRWPLREQRPSKGDGP